MIENTDLYYSTDQYLKWDEFPDDTTMGMKFHYYEGIIKDQLTNEFISRQQKFLNERVAVSESAIKHRAMELLKRYNVLQNIPGTPTINMDIDHEGNAKINVIWLVNPYVSKIQIPIS